MKVEIDGAPATAEQLQHPATVNYGHYTSAQVRGGRVRGLELHLARLVAATHELFDADLDPDRLRAHIRHALAGTEDASLRVNIYQDQDVTVLITLRPPLDVPPLPRRLQSVSYQRPVPHIKHVGSFGQIHFARQAERHGFDEALLTAPDGEISETATANIGFLDGATVVWPAAPCLAGTAMQLLEPRLDSRREPVRLADLARFSGAFTASSTGIAAVGQVDDTAFTVDAAAMAPIRSALESVAWDTI